MDITQRIEELKREIRDTPYHKGTEHHIGRLRARIAKLEDDLLARTTKTGKGGGRGYAVKKAGDATVVLVGPPSVGKSTLLNALTNAKSPVAPYAFTTVTVIPGMMKYKGAEIQILDVPGLIEGASRGRGRGKQVISVVRGADLLLLVTEVGKENAFKEIESELYEAGVRINQRPPNIKIERKLGGGIIVHSAAKQQFDNTTVKDVAQEFGLRNAEITLKEKIVLEDLVDAFAQNRVYVPAILVLNKVDTPVYHISIYDIAIPVSAKTGVGLDKLRKSIWEKLKFVRAYLAKPGRGADYETPLILKNGATIYDIANKVGTEFAARVKGAKISGPGAKFPSQEVPVTTRVQDEMEVMFLT